LVEQFEDLPQSVYTAYILAQKADRGNSPGINTSTKLLNACASDFFQTYSNPVFILLDALDEFVNKHEQDRQRDDLLSSLAGLCLEGHVKLLFTTRPQFREQLQEKFNDSVVIEATTDHNDVKKYLDSKLEYSDLPEDLKSSIKCTIAEQAGDIP
jgi:leucyl-tRNA synthetase